VLQPAPASCFCARRKLTGLAGSAQKQERALPEQIPDRSVHTKCVPSVYQFPDDLTEVVDVWPRLSAETREKIQALVDE